MRYRSAAAWGRLGKILLAHEFSDEARACFAQAEALDPAEPRWPYHQGTILSQGEPDAAIPKLQRAVERCGNDPDAPRLRLAEILLAQGRPGWGIALPVQGLFTACSSGRSSSATGT